MLVGDAVYKDLVAFLLMAVFMFFKPNGLLGEENGKKLSPFTWLKSRVGGGSRKEAAK